MNLVTNQAKGFALAASRLVLDGGVGRMLEMARANLRSGRDRTSQSRELPAERAALERFRAACNGLDARRADFVSSPNDLTAEQVRWAEVEVEDAIAVAGEFQVYDLPWSLA